MSAQGIDECMINVHYYFITIKSKQKSKQGFVLGEIKLVIFASRIFNLAGTETNLISTGRNPISDHHWSKFKFLLKKQKILPAEIGEREQKRRESVYMGHSPENWSNLWHRW